jgi:hypothetical protein
MCIFMHCIFMHCIFMRCIYLHCIFLHHGWPDASILTGMASRQPEPMCVAQAPSPAKARMPKATCAPAHTPIKAFVASVSTYLEKYLQELQEIRSSGEASYYPPLRELLNSVGDELKPKVRCILILKNRGAGLPDGYYIGGYQVIKKWLSYREGKVARPGAKS